jgi:hypothetical protein
MEDNVKDNIAEKQGIQGETYAYMKSRKMVIVALSKT